MFESSIFPIVTIMMLLNEINKTTLSKCCYYESIINYKIVNRNYENVELYTKHNTILSIILLLLVLNVFMIILN